MYVQGQEQEQGKNSGKIALNILTRLLKYSEGWWFHLNYHHKYKDIFQISGTL